VRSSNLRLFIAGGLLVAIGLAMLVSGFASGSPDGLNKVAEDPASPPTPGSTCSRTGRWPGTRSRASTATA